MKKRTVIYLSIGVALLGISNHIFAYLNNRGSEEYPNPVFKRGE